MKRLPTQKELVLNMKRDLEAQLKQVNKLWALYQKNPTKVLRKKVVLPPKSIGTISDHIYTLMFREGISLSVQQLRKLIQKDGREVSKATVATTLYRDNRFFRTGRGLYTTFFKP